MSGLSQGAGPAPIALRAFPRDIGTRLLMFPGTIFSAPSVRLTPILASLVLAVAASAAPAQNSTSPSGSSLTPAPAPQEEIPVTSQGDEKIKAEPAARPDSGDSTQVSVGPLEETPKAKAGQHPVAPIGAVPEEPEIFEPPLPAPAAEIDSVPAPKASHRSPKTSLWMGARVGWLFPSGALWRDGYIEDRLCCLYEYRGWSEVATSGPMFELDIGARFSRRYSVLALWEYSSLGPGKRLGNEFGGQQRGDSHFLGAGLRFSSDPDDVGVVVEVALGWRHFKASWERGTELIASDDFFNTRLGLGVDIRVNEHLALSPLMTIGGGVFMDPEWKFADGSSTSALGPLGDASQHTVFSFQLGAHFDLLQSKP